MARLNGRRLLGLGLLAGACALAAPVALHTAKAFIGQALFEHAWVEAAAGAPPRPPWRHADFKPAGRLSFKDRADLIVADRASGEALAWAPGLALQGQATVIAGHRDTHFAGLKDLKRGDRLTWIPLGGAPVSYKVARVERLPTPTFTPWTGAGPVLHLATCAPRRPGDTEGRLVVTAVPAPMETS